MTEEEQAPRVADLAWGRIELEGGETFKDAKLWPGGAREWDWNETGTHHVPGVQPADVEEILERGVSTLVIGRGVLGALRVTDETRELLAGRGVEVVVEKTEEAVRRYNELRERKAVGAVIHSTC